MISVVRDSELLLLIIWRFVVGYFWPTLYVIHDSESDVTFHRLFFGFVPNIVLIVFLLSADGAVLKYMTY